MRIRGRPFPIIFAAPSGAGKTTIARELRKRRDDLVFSVSATTRAPRSYERDGEHYHFVDEAEFRRRIDAGEMLEWAEVHGNLYGTPASNLDDATGRGKFLVLDIDVQGSRQVRKLVPEAVSIFVLPPSGSRLADRLKGRGSEDEAIQQKRLRNALEEIEAAGEFDYVIVNDDLSTAVDAVDAILRAEACRVCRLRMLPEHLEGLAEEINSALRTNVASAGEHPEQ